MDGTTVNNGYHAGNPTDSVFDFTKGVFDDYWGNLAMYGGWCPAWPEGGHGPYGAYVDGLSDEVWGMGLPCNRHVNFRLIWQWTESRGGVIPSPLSTVISPMDCSTYNACPD